MTGDIEDDRGLEAEAQAQEEEKQKRKTARQAEKDLIAAYRSTMATPQGRAVMWDILSSLGVFHSPLVPGSQDLTYVKIGSQNAGLELMTKLFGIDASRYIEMEKENRT